ncbi:MAG: hypothetical protein Q4G70_09790 [Pseudomonadota bacterium]|nr:hypothetical protein [Pseudomonadota bacterium]
MSAAAIRRPVLHAGCAILLGLSLSAGDALAGNSCTRMVRGGDQTKTTPSDQTATCASTGRGVLPAGGDPMVFCTEGVPEHCWVATSPVSGEWSSICFGYVNPYWIDTYERMCPAGRPLDGTGYNWQGRKGIPNMVGKPGSVPH